MVHRDMQGTVTQSSYNSKYNSHTDTADVSGFIGVIGACRTGLMGSQRHPAIPMIHDEL